MSTHALHLCMICKAHIHKWLHHLIPSNSGSKRNHCPLTFGNYSAGTSPPAPYTGLCYPCWMTRFIECPVMSPCSVFSLQADMRASAYAVYPRYDPVILVERGLTLIYSGKICVRPNGQATRMLHQKPGFDSPA